MSFSDWANEQFYLSQSRLYGLIFDTARSAAQRYYEAGRNAAKSIVVDAAALVIGNTYGKARVFRDDAKELYSNIQQGMWVDAAGTFAVLLVDLAFPNYGFYGGLSYGVRQKDNGPWHDPINNHDRNHRTHDLSKGDHYHWGWIESNYTQVPPGPVGAAYVIAGTPLFLLGAGYQWLAN
jgi:hypothetical protein